MSVTAGGGASPLTNQARRKTPVSVRRWTLVPMEPWRQSCHQMMSEPSLFLSFSFQKDTFTFPCVAFVCKGLSVTFC